MRGTCSLLLLAFGIRGCEQDSWFADYSQWQRCMLTPDVLWCRVIKPVNSSHVRQHWQQSCTAAANEGCTAGHQMN